jgi:hypothetical protein
MELGPVLMSVGIAQYGAVPLLADLNNSHATNSDWPPHARFHVLTQTLTSTLLAIVAMGVLWWPGRDPAARADLAATISGSVLGGFFLAALASRFVRADISAPAARRFGGVDGNIANFGAAALLLISGWLLTR